MHFANTAREFALIDESFRERGVRPPHQAIPRERRIRVIRSFVSADAAGRNPP